MLNRVLSEAFQDLSTPLIADACLRLGVPLRLAAPGIRPVLPAFRVAGHVLPVRHYGSVDIFLESMGTAEPGDVLVIDNGGRMDEGCIGDLDGVLFVQSDRLDDLLSTARTIWQTERRQAQAAQGGRSLRMQLRFDEYLRKRVKDPSYTFREHLKAMGGAVEE